jgi:protein-L-isoaspartate(D-aspartate) O-methyltransferase
MSPRFDFAAARRQMVEQQLKTQAIHDPRILALLGRLPREEFVPVALRTLAYADLELPLGHGAVMERPSYVGAVLAAVRPRAGERVLEVGTGSGYLSACLAELGASVHTVEIEPALAARARRALASIVPDASVTVETADVHTWDGAAGVYDAVVLGGSLPVWDPSFLDSLRPGGRLLAAVGVPPLMTVRLYTRAPAGPGVACRNLFETVLPPLRGLDHTRARPTASHPATVFAES